MGDAVDPVLELPVGPDAALAVVEGGPVGAESFRRTVEEFRAAVEPVGVRQFREVEEETRPPVRRRQPVAGERVEVGRGCQLHESVPLSWWGRPALHERIVLVTAVNSSRQGCSVALEPRRPGARGPGRSVTLEPGRPRAPGRRHRTAHGRRTAQGRRRPRASERAHMPAFSLDPEQTTWCAELRTLAAERLKPLADKGEPGRVNRPLVAALGELGLLARLFDAGALELCLLRESLARTCTEAETALALQGLGTHPVAAFGTPAQRARWLPEATAGRAVAAFALSEPGVAPTPPRWPWRPVPTAPAAGACTARSDGSPTPPKPTSPPSSPAPPRTPEPAGSPPSSSPPTGRDSAARPSTCSPRTPSAP